MRSFIFIFLSSPLWIKYSDNELYIFCILTVTEIDFLLRINNYYYFTIFFIFITTLIEMRIFDIAKDVIEIFER